MSEVITLWLSQTNDMPGRSLVPPRAIAVHVTPTSYCHRPSGVRYGETRYPKYALGRSLFIDKENAIKKYIQELKRRQDKLDREKIAINTQIVNWNAELSSDRSES